MPNAVDGDTVLDGDLIAGQGTPGDFYRLGPRLSASRPVAVRRWANRVPLTLAVFEVLAIGREPLVHDPYRDRRLVLERMRLSSPGWLAMSSFEQGGAKVFAACERLRLDGVVAKRLESRYQCSPRSGEWVKVKTSSWRTDHGPRRHENWNT